MIRALIVEDEPMAQAQLARLIKTHFPDIEVVAMTDSVRSTVAFLTADPPINVIFMDVELSDGECFEIFRQVPVHSQVIMTTAYDSYAVKAFEAGSIDYLLKPISEEALTRAVSRVRARTEVLDVEKLLAAVAPRRRQYRERATVRVGDQIIPVKVADIAFFYSEDKSNYLVMDSGERYLVDITLDALEGELDPEQFFRVTRGCIVARHAVRRVGRHFSGRLRLETIPAPPCEFTVSRARVDDFLKWLE